jgi:hypothetical protein
VIDGALHVGGQPGGEVGGSVSLTLMLVVPPLPVASMRTPLAHTTTTRANGTDTGEVVAEAKRGYGNDAAADWAGAWERCAPPVPYVFLWL